MNLFVSEERRFGRVLNKFSESLDPPYLLCNEDGLREFLHQVRAHVDMMYDVNIPVEFLDGIIEDQTGIGRVRFPFKRDGFLWRLLTLN
jgi:hypothetical protein